MIETEIGADNQVFIVAYRESYYFRHAFISLIICVLFCNIIGLVWWIIARKEKFIFSQPEAVRNRILGIGINFLALDLIFTFSYLIFSATFFEQFLFTFFPGVLLMIPLVLLSVIVIYGVYNVFVKRFYSYHIKIFSITNPQPLAHYLGRV